jgi:hypothetical protein
VREVLLRSEIPLADPVVTVDTKLKATRARTWKQGASVFLLLEDDVGVDIGAYAFRSDRAVIRIDVEETPGRKINNLSIYLDNARPKFGNTSVWAQAPRLLVTASTVGNIDLSTNLLREESAEGETLVMAAEDRIDRHLAAVAQPTLGVPPGHLFDPTAEARRQATHAQIARTLDQQQAAAIAALEQSLPKPPPPLAPGAGAGATPTRPPGPGPAAPGSVAQVPGGAGAPISTQPQTQPGGGPALVGTPVEGLAPIMPRRGVLTFNAKKVIYEAGDKQEKCVVLMGNVNFFYSSEDKKQTTDIRAENGVVFLESSGDEKVTGNQVSAAKVRGIYLEDNVIITDGNYTVRAPRVYYDLGLNKALLLDAVFYVYDDLMDLSAYVRAKEMRQVARSVWTARHAVMTTTEFAEPEFSVSASKVTVTQEPRPETGSGGAGTGAASAPGSSGAAAGAGGSGGSGGKPITHVESVNNVPRFEEFPIFYWPYAAGDAEKTALSSLTMGVNTDSGYTTHSTWDLFVLSGQDKPQGVDLLGHADLEGKHGPSTGLDLGYVRPDYYGSLTGSVLPDDSFRDRIGGRNDVLFNDETRGYTIWQHRQYLPDDWQVTLEVHKVSDPTYLEEFHRELAENSGSFDTSIYAKKQEDSWAFTAFVSGDIDNFTPQTTVLQAPGYRVDKLPELGFYEIGTSFWDNRLTYYSENRVSRMRIIPGNDTPASRGFTDAQSLALFDIPASTSFAERAQDENLPNDYRLRLDSRHEIDAPLKAGTLDASPSTTSPCPWRKPTRARRGGGAVWARGCTPRSRVRMTALTCPCSTYTGFGTSSSQVSMPS